MVDVHNARLGIGMRFFQQPVGCSAPIPGLLFTHKFCGRTLLIPLVSLFFKAMPDSINEGPFNHRTDGGFFSDGDVVPNTLYFNNNTDYYTIWDDKLEKYITYNKSDNYKLDKVVFNAPETGKVSDRLHLIKGWEYVVKTSDGLRNSPRIVIANNKIMPTSHLDAEGMKIQEQYGCAGCHEM